jgi:predicted TIM-barrel fold metal-dependent hydrolase
MEPADKMVPYVGSSVGEDVICYASDYCHWDCAFPDSVKQIEARPELSDGYKRRIFAANAAKLYGIEVP